MRTVSNGTILAVVFALTLAGCGIFGDSGGDNPDPTPTPVPVETSTATQEPTPTEAPPQEMSWEDVVEHMEPSVVLIRADFPSTVVSFEGQGSGTGIVYSDEGYILTNAHVVSGAAALTVAAAGSNRERSARFVGVSTCDDLAVIKVDDMEGLSAATLGASGQERIGAEVAALGYPLGSAIGTDMTVSRGVISKLNEPLLHFESLIQHDASLSPGNSGGPLVNRKGEVVGINSIGFDPSVASNINFAISIDQAKRIIDGLESGQNRHWLGLNLVPNLYAEYFGTDSGLVVSAVSSGSSASSMGVKPAYLLTHLQGLTVESQEDVCRILRSHQDGDALKVQFTHITDTEVQYLEGEVVLGTGDGGAEVSVVHREIFSQDQASSGNGSDVLTIGVWAGTADVGIDYWAPCGTGGDWVHYHTEWYAFDVTVYVDAPYEDEWNPYNLGILSEPFEVEGGFVMITSDVLEDSGGAYTWEYWDVDYSGTDVGGELMDTGSMLGESRNFLLTHVAHDPCNPDAGGELTPLVIDVGATFAGYLGSDDGFLEFSGTTEDLTRDVVILVELDRID